MSNLDKSLKFKRKHTGFMRKAMVDISDDDDDVSKKDEFPAPDTERTETNGNMNTDRNLITDRSQPESNEGKNEKPSFFSMFKQITKVIP